MLNIRKYANGRFFNTEDKSYIKIDKLKEIIQKGEKIKVTMAKTGKDITDTVLAELADQKAKSSCRKKTDGASHSSFIKTDGLKKWAGKLIDKRISEVLDLIKLPTRDQVADLNANIETLNKKFDELKALQEKQQRTVSKSADAAAAPASEAKKKKPVKKKPVKKDPVKAVPVAEKSAKAEPVKTTPVEKTSVKEEPVKEKSPDKKKSEHTHTKKEPDVVKEPTNKTAGTIK